MGSTLRKIFRRLEKIENNMRGIEVKQEIRIESNDKNQNGGEERTSVHTQLDEVIQLLRNISGDLRDIKNSLK